MTRRANDALLRNSRQTKQQRLEVSKKEELTRSQKGWQTRYKNEIAIIDAQLETLKDDLYDAFISFISKTAKYQDLTRLRERLHRKHKGGPS